jgi:Response regulator of the LytR/AlgR family
MPKYMDRIIRLIKNNINRMNKRQVSEVTEAVLEHASEFHKSIIVPTENNTVRLVSISDILYVEEIKNQFYIHLSFEIIKFVSPTNIAEILIKNGFSYLSRNTLVNINKLMYFDSYYRRAYFHEDKYVEITGAAIVQVLNKTKLVDVEKQLNNVNKIRYS